MAEDNADQIAFWGGDAGQTWVAHQAAMDVLLTPVLDGVLARAGIQAGQHVLDVGCGTGQSTVAAGQRTGPTGRIVGADVSAPMLTRARKRATDLEQVSFACEDVAQMPFDRAFDHLISRFGVMFFADTAAAFANMAAALKSGGKMTIATWGAIDQNPWFTLPARIGRDLFGPVPKSDPDGPGPFAMRDVAQVEAMLRGAGFAQVQTEVETLQLSLDGDAADMADLCLHIGPAAITQKHFDLDAQDRARLKQALAGGFAALPDGHVPAQINFFTAVRP